MQFRPKLLRTKTCVVPATVSGFYVLETQEQEDDTLTVIKTPVVAWRIAEEVNDNDRTDGSTPIADPICVRGRQEDAAVLGPDGSVHSCDTSWTSVDDWLSFTYEERAAIREQHDEISQKCRDLLAQKPAPPINPFAPRTLTLKSRSEAER
jgi:hypothetical protein